MENRLILDVSLGRDSFYSIMTVFQNENANIEAITVQDPSMARTCHGMLHLLEHLYTEIPVCRGSIDYLGEKGNIDKSVSSWPNDIISPISASEMIYLKANLFPKELTVISHSPLTNIALLLRDHKDTEKKIKKLVILDNRTVDAKEDGFDFQPFTDIAAAEELINSELDIYLIPRDILKITDKNKFVIDFIKESKDTMIGRFLRHSKMGDNDEAILCALAACLTALEPTSFTSEKWDVKAVFAGDKKGSYLLEKSDPASNVNVVTSIDYKKALREGFGVVDTPKTRAYNKIHEGEDHHHA